MAYEGDVNERWSWTENRVHELRRLIAEKLTSSEIAQRLQTSENAVRNKVWRLGEQLASGRGRPRLSEDVRQTRTEAVSSIPVERVERWPQIPLPALRHVETHGVRVTLADLPDVGACRWPMSHAMEPGSVRTPFCGCRTYGLTYCASHEALARKDGVRISLVA